jgi:hypothetical protein
VNIRITRTQSDLSQSHSAKACVNPSATESTQRENHISGLFHHTVVETVEMGWWPLRVTIVAADNDGSSGRCRSLDVARYLRLQFRGLVSHQPPVQQAILIVAAQEHEVWLQRPAGIRQHDAPWKTRLDQLLLRISQSRSLPSSLEWLLDELMVAFDAVEIAYGNLQLRSSA